MLRNAPPRSRTSMKVPMPMPPKMPRQNSMVGVSAAMMRVNRPAVLQMRAEAVTSTMPSR